MTMTTNATMTTSVPSISGEKKMKRNVKANQHAASDLAIPAFQTMANNSISTMEKALNSAKVALNSDNWEEVASQMKLFDVFHDSVKQTMKKLDSLLASQQSEINPAVVS